MLFGERDGCEKLIRLFEKTAKLSEPLLMSVMNWGEVYCQVARRYGEPQAREIERLIQSFPIDIIDADRELTREAARVKAGNRLANADCFAVALVRIRKAEVYTGDPEFRTVEEEVKIIWL